MTSWGFILKKISLSNTACFPSVNDITVLRLSKALIFNDYVSPVCLPTQNIVMPPICTVIGWGAVSCKYFAFRIQKRLSLC